MTIVFIGAQIFAETSQSQAKELRQLKHTVEDMSSKLLVIFHYHFIRVLSVLLSHVHK